MNPQQLLNSLRGVQAQHVAASPMLRQVSATIDWEGQEEDWLKDIQSGKSSVGQMLQNARAQNVQLARLLWALMQLQLIQLFSQRRSKIRLLGVYKRNSKPSSQGHILMF